MQIIFYRLASTCGVTLDPIALMQVPKRRTISDSDKALESKPVLGDTSSINEPDIGSIVSSLKRCSDSIPSPYIPPLKVDRQSSWSPSGTNGRHPMMEVTSSVHSSNGSIGRPRSNSNSIILEMNSIPS